MSNSSELALQGNPGAPQERNTDQGAQGVRAPSAAFDPSLPEGSLDKRVSSETATAQKAHRARRACDECRGRKIRCDGRHPCLHCIALNLDCTYDKPDKRSTRISRREVEDLASKLQRARNLLWALAPNLDLDDPHVDATVLSKLQLPASNTRSPVATTTTLSESSHQSPHGPAGPDQDANLATVLEETGRLGLDEKGNWSYQSHGSSSAFVRRLGERFGDMSDLNIEDKTTNLRLGGTPDIFESPDRLMNSAFKDSSGEFISLPPRDIAVELATSALNEACALFNFVHKPSFFSMLEEIYLLNPAQYTDKEHRFLPLLYSILALGYLFSRNERVHFGYTHAISEGMRYFTASRQMIDIAQCQNIFALQTVVFMTLFLHSSASMPTCHSYISVAMAASLQMGLHCSQPAEMDPVERETRKRLFWTIRTLETYIVVILGLPRTISDDDIDQEMPLEIDDEYITKEGIFPMPEGRVSLITASNAHIRLAHILGKVSTDVYPAKRMQKEASQKTRAYIVNNAKVHEVENDLQSWMMSLPTHLRPGPSASKDLTRVQHLLRLAFTHVQITLYRPFLHYISQSHKDNLTSKQCYAYAAACVDVGRNAIYNARQMGKQDILTGPYWFSIYTTFCTTLSLTFHVWENAEVENALETIKDAEYGRHVLTRLAYQSKAAESLSQTLGTKIIFTRLPDRLGNEKQNARSKMTAQRKRPQSSSRPDPTETQQHNIFVQQDHSTTDSQDLEQLNIVGHDPLDMNPNLNFNLDPTLWMSNQTLNTSSSFTTRFLGPDSIEEIFGSAQLAPGNDWPDSSQPRTDLHLNLGLDSSTLGMDLSIPTSSHTFSSLDQYVSMLNFDFDGGNDKVLDQYPHV